MTSDARPPSAAHGFRARVLDVATFREIALEIQRTDSDPEGVGIMTRKARIFPVRLEGVSLKASPILKQEMLSVGGDAAHAKGVADHSVTQSDVVLLATLGQYRRALPKLRRQPFRLSPLADAIESALRHFTATAPRTVRGTRRSLTVGERTVVMGVVNVTPDSFSDGGRYFELAAAVARVHELVGEGAGWIDIGGESTRPGAKAVDEAEEWRRVGPVLEAVGRSLEVPISIDTRHPSVAAKAIAAGADFVNDVGGLRLPEMRRVVHESGAGAIAMHMRGDPTTMQSDLSYSDLRSEVFAGLSNATASAIAEGIGEDRLLVDPGLGFGKSPEQNLELLRHLREFRSLGVPIVVGASRKSFLGWAIGGAPPEDRTEAGLAAAVLAAEHGADIVRVHDVAPAVRALRFADAVGRAGLSRPTVDEETVGPPE